MRISRNLQVDICDWYCYISETCDITPQPTELQRIKFSLTQQVFTVYQYDTSIGAAKAEHTC